MKSAPSRILIKFLKITGITIGSLLVLMFLFPYLFPGFVAGKIKQWARSSISSELNFSAARLSFFKHFPALTLTLYDLDLKGSAPFEKDVLVKADEIALGVDLRSVFSSSVRIDKIFLVNAFINIQVDKEGHANYNVYRAAKQTNASHPADSTGASLQIKKILIEKSKLVYDDRSLPMLIDAKDVFYEGNGDLSKAIFDLNSHTEIGAIDFYYNQRPYFVSKKINADLVTKINTNSLSFFFEKNQLTINSLPIGFTGSFSFLKNGYDMDFQLKSIDSDLHDIFTAMPPNMVEWLTRTDVKGFGDIEASLKGQYIASENNMPDLALDMKIRNGSISGRKAPAPVTDLFLNFRSRLPGLNPDSLSVNVDSLYFNIDKDNFNAQIRLKGIREPLVYARVNTEIDLEKWSKAFGIGAFDVKGRYSLHAEAQGRYATRVVHTGFRNKTDTILASIPSFLIRSSLADGYFKYASRPEAIRHISFELDASCPDHDYRHTSLSLQNINANLLSSYIKGFFKLKNAGDFPIDAELETVFHLADIEKVVPLDSMELAGDLAIGLRSNGRFLPAKKIFPVTKANLVLQNGRVKTKYYPHPIENIRVSADISSSKGSLKDLAVSLTPVSFVFEGQPFLCKADVKDFGNLQYDISSKGRLDLGKIYRVFARQGYDVKGFIETDLSLRGLQSDATAGRYDRLFNAGTLKLKDVFLSSELFPRPFWIRSGLFRFDKDKMWFDTFNASYGKTSLTLNGYLSGYIDHMMDNRSPLKGQFDLKSDFIWVDEFMAFADSSSRGVAGRPVKAADLSATPSKRDSSPANVSAPGGSGVVLVPPGLSIGFNADVKKVRYNGIDLADVKGQLLIDSGSIRLNQAGFMLIGAPVVMDASYKSLSPRRAEFGYHIGVKEFDIKRAYNEIKIFHDLASSASKAEGIVSLDYQLSGKLDGDMHPVYPSLKGGGVLSIKKVKVKGMKLFGAVSHETNKDVNDPDLSKVELKSTINNNLITIPRTRMKVSVFKIRFEGQASFDGKLNMQFRVGLPPFGVIGIPVKVTGTEDNPHVQAGRGSKKDQLQETEDKDEEGKEN
ncbi:MAG: AsmA-like C-terminal region-containing protein [Puia sp.]|nr:AsmA-like C-terminal region-containing protein [Puia sp.]